MRWKNLFLGLYQRLQVHEKATAARVNLALEKEGLIDRNDKTRWRLTIHKKAGLRLVSRTKRWRKGTWFPEKRPGRPRCFDYSIGACSAFETFYDLLRGELHLKRTYRNDHAKIITIKKQVREILDDVVTLSPLGANLGRDAALARVDSSLASCASKPPHCIVWHVLGVLFGLVDKRGNPNDHAVRRQLKIVAKRSKQKNKKDQ